MLSFPHSLASNNLAGETRHIKKSEVQGSSFEVKAKVTIPEKAVETCSQKVELQIEEFWVINKSAPILPF